MSKLRVEEIMETPWSKGFDTVEASHLYSRFMVNLDRCNQLIRHGYTLRFEPATQELGDEVLRAAVVMLHATFEDYLRTLTRVVLPILANRTALDKLRFPGTVPDERRPDNITVAELALRYKDKTVKEVIDMAVDGYCKRLSISTTEDFEQLLRRLGRDPELFRPAFPVLAWLMERRHRIAHEADITLTPHEGGFAYFGFATDDGDDGQRQFVNLINCLRDVCMNGLHPWYCGMLANELRPAPSNQSPDSGGKSPTPPGPATP